MPSTEYEEQVQDNVIVWLWQKLFENWQRTLGIISTDSRSIALRRKYL